MWWSTHVRIPLHVRKHSYIRIYIYINNLVRFFDWNQVGQKFCGQREIVWADRCIWANKIGSHLSVYVMVIFLPALQWSAEAVNKSNSIRVPCKWRQICWNSLVNIRSFDHEIASHSHRVSFSQIVRFWWQYQRL